MMPAEALSSGAQANRYSSMGLQLLEQADDNGLPASETCLPL